MRADHACRHAQSDDPPRPLTGLYIGDWLVVLCPPCWQFAHDAATDIFDFARLHGVREAQR